MNPKLPSQHPGKYGLLGRKLSHSYSVQIHKHLGEYPYQLYEIEPQDLGSFLRSEEFDGLNITIPYKSEVIPYCSELSPVAQRLGAVNTLIRRSDGSLMGHNTDYYGFLSTVQQSGLLLKGKKVLVLGSGGASKAVCAVLEDLACNVIVISRSGENNYQNIALHADAALLVNATPVGMYPNNGISPINIDLLPNLEGVIDLIYNPGRTALIQQAAQKGLIAINGLWMLVAQAKESSQWFTGKVLADNLIQKISRILQMQMENIVLIGMPGSGKSTIGKLLAHELGRTFVDTDDIICASAGHSISEIFKHDGEAAFRKLETEALAQVGKESGLVIATGGGCVTRSENYPLLHQNGRIYWIQRDIALLPTDGRPLSQTGQLTKMYQIRRPLYEAFADHVIQNEKDPLSAVFEITHTEGH